MCGKADILNAFTSKCWRIYLADNPRWNLYYTVGSDGDGSFSPVKTFEARTLTAVFDEGIYTIPEGFGLSNSEV